MFGLKIRHGDGDEAGQAEAGRDVLREGAGGSAWASLLRAVERRAGGGGVRSVLRRAMPRFLSHEVGAAVAGSGRVFRLLLIGFFEGIGSERGIAWRVADSFSLRRFLKYGLNEATPDHVTISRTRRLVDEAAHQAVFTFVLTEVARRGMLKGKTIGIDAT